MCFEHRRLAHALLLSLLIHTLLLYLVFDGQGTGILGFRFPWQDRRIEVPDLRLVLVQTQAPGTESASAAIAQPLRQAWVERHVSGGPAVAPSVHPSPTLGRTGAAIVPQDNPNAETHRMADAATDVAPADSPSRADRPDDTALRSVPAPDVIALAPSDEANRVVPAVPAMPVPVPVIAVASGTSNPESTMPPLRDAGDAAPTRIDQKPEERVVEPAVLDPANETGQRPERLEAARLDTAHEEAARLEAERQEAAQQAVARQESARQEAARQEAARQEAARQEAARQEAARQEAARQEAARQEAAGRREAALRAIGRQLDEEAARREAASAAARQLPYSSGARRGRLFGRTDPNAELVLYAEAWSRKIELNMTFDMVREAAKQSHTNPVVTVAIRSDGSIESVTFVLSSGVAAIDEAIRRIIDSQKPYQGFPPALAREFDVIEIRRTWYFDVAIRLY
jgi:hypothetical protein